MKWQLIKKDKAKQPPTGCYKDWKPQIAEECYHQCVYCAISESQFGGIDNYHIEHFKPKSKFRHLENDICNLFLACPICNRFKGNDWPAESDINTISYPNPAMNDFSDFFKLEANFELLATNVSANYLLTRLFLNRAQLIMERREDERCHYLTTLMGEINNLSQQIAKQHSTVDSEILTSIMTISYSLSQLNEKRRMIIPYKLTDIRKP